VGTIAKSYCSNEMLNTARRQAVTASSHSIMRTPAGHLLQIIPQPDVLVSMYNKLLFSYAHIIRDRNCILYGNEKWPVKMKWDYTTHLSVGCVVVRN